jgi:diacylglycerol kinase family enzyme
MAETAVRIPVFVNTLAGLHPVDQRALADQLGADRVDVAVVEPTAIGERVGAAAASGARIVGVAGGDGTLRTAAAALMGTETALLCVPTGTLNNFARRAGIDSVSSASAALRRPRLEKFALGTIRSAPGDDVFLNTVTFGEYSRIVRMRERYRRYVGKWPAALVAFIVALVTLRRIALELIIDGEAVTHRTPLVWTGIGWGSFPRTHESAEQRRRPDLEIAVLRSPGAAAALGFVLRLGFRMLARGGPLDDRRLELLHARQFAVSADHTIDATADGEVLRLEPPIVLAVRDDALSVLVGPGYTR